MEFSRGLESEKISPPTAGHARVVDEDVIGRRSGRVRVKGRVSRVIDAIAKVKRSRDGSPGRVTRRNVLTERARLEPTV
jgi:hypothetical protein